MRAAAALVIVLAVVLVVCGEALRRRGRVRPPLSDRYLTPSALIAPYNLWASLRTEGGDVPFPSMEVHFPAHTTLRDKWGAIRDEAARLRGAGLASGIENDRFFRRIADGRWKKFYIKWYGEVLPDARAACPETCALLDRLPEVHLAMFSILGPGAVIPPHTGPFKGCLRYHLGLECPPGGAEGPATITVDGEDYSWREGEDVLFDDTYLHEVRNPTEGTRVVLFCDVERRLDGARAREINRWVCRKLAPHPAPGGC